MLNHMPRWAGNGRMVPERGAVRKGPWMLSVATVYDWGKVWGDGT